MKKAYLITALVLVLGLMLSLPYTAQAQEEEYREVYLESAYKINDTQIVFDFSEPVKINEKAPWNDIRLTNQSGDIISKKDALGNQVGYYQWRLDYAYLNADHDKIIFTMNVKQDGCDSISDLLDLRGDFPDEIKEKVQKGTYRFLVGMEEMNLTTEKAMSDGKIKNLVSEADSDVFVWPTRLRGGECVHWWLDELMVKPTDLVVNEELFESMSGKGQDWDFEIMELGPLPEADQPVPVMIKNDPIVVVLILVGGMVVTTALVLISFGIYKKRKAA